MNYENELNNILNEEEEQQQYYDESFRIDSLEKAVWADEKVRENEIQIQEIEKIAQTKIEELETKIQKMKDWTEKSSEKYQNNITFFKQHLHLYHQQQIEEQKIRNAELEAKGKKPKALPKTIKLPYRNLTCKAQSPSILINGKEPDKAKSDPLFVEFVKTNDPDMVKVNEEVKWGDYKKSLKTIEQEGKLVYVDSNGEVIDFIELAQRGESYDWKVIEEEKEESNS